MPGLRALLLLLLLALAIPVHADDKLPVQVYLADGSNVMLRDWSLSYEYVAWRSGTSPALATPARRAATAVWLGKRVLPVSGQVLRILYQEITRERELEGRMQRVKVMQAKGLTLGKVDSRNELKIEAPARELLLPDADKKLTVIARSLDLRGDTLTGTRRELCLLSYSALVECGENPGDRVVKVEFP